jgi:hypothetical protein
MIFILIIETQSGHFDWFESFDFAIDSTQSDDVKMHMSFKQ